MTSVTQTSQAVDFHSKDGFLEDVERGPQTGGTPWEGLCCTGQFKQAQEKAMWRVGGLRPAMSPFCSPVL